MCLYLNTSSTVVQYHSGAIWEMFKGFYWHVIEFTNNFLLSLTVDVDDH